MFVDVAHLTAQRVARWHRTVLQCDLLKRTDIAYSRPHGARSLSLRDRLKPTWAARTYGRRWRMATSRLSFGTACRGRLKSCVDESMGPSGSQAERAIQRAIPVEDGCDRSESFPDERDRGKHDPERRLLAMPRSSSVASERRTGSTS